MVTGFFTTVRRARVRAYTLTEMLVVLVIIGLLAAIIGPRLFSRLDDAKVRTARLQMTSLQTAVDLFRLDVGRVPAADEGLSVLVEQPDGETGWLGPYLSRDALPTDPWGAAYVYELDETGYRIVSYGADGREGGSAGATDLFVAAAVNRNDEANSAVEQSEQAATGGVSPSEPSPTQ